MTEIFRQIIDHPSAWTGAQLGGKEGLTYRLTAEELALRANIGWPGCVKIEHQNRRRNGENAIAERHQPLNALASDSVVVMAHRGEHTQRDAADRAGHLLCPARHDHARPQGPG